MQDQQRLETALRNAHAAGDTRAAQRLAQELKKVRDGSSGQGQSGHIQGQQDSAKYLGKLISTTREGNSGRATTALLSAANSSTLGALDPILDGMDRAIPGHTGQSSGSVRHGLKEQHPVSGIVGDVAGFAAPGGAVWKGGQSLAKALPQLPGKGSRYAGRLAGLAGLGGAENAAFQSTVGASNMAAKTGETVTLPERVQMAKDGATNPLALAAGPALSLAGRGLQGMFTGRVTPKHLQPQANAPTLDEIGNMRDAAYKATDEMGVSYSPDGLQEMAANLSQKLDGVNIDQHLHPRAHRVKEILQEKVQTGMTLPQLDNLRKFVRNNVVASNEPSEKMLGRMMIDEIDGFINAGNHAVTGSGDDAAEAIVGARKLHQVHSKGQQIADAEQAASLRASSTGSGGNYENALRQELRKIYQNPKKIAGFTEAERASMLKVIEGDPVQNLMRNVGKLSPQGNGLMSALGIGTTAANPWLAPVWFAGMGAKHLAERGVRNKFDDLDKLVRSAAEAPPMKNITPPSGGTPPRRVNPKEFFTDSAKGSAVMAPDYPSNAVDDALQRLGTPESQLGQRVDDGIIGLRNEMNAAADQFEQMIANNPRQSSYVFSLPDDPRLGREAVERMLKVRDQQRWGPNKRADTVLVMSADGGDMALVDRALTQRGGAFATTEATTGSGVNWFRLNDVADFDAVPSRLDNVATRGKGILGNQRGSIDIGGGPQRRKDLLKEAMSKSQGAPVEGIPQPSRRADPSLQAPYAEGPPGGPLPWLAGVGAAGMAGTYAYDQMTQPRAVDVPAAPPQVPQTFGPSVKPDLSGAQKASAERANMDARTQDQAERQEYWQYLKSRGDDSPVVWNQIHQKRASELRVTPQDRARGVSRKRLPYVYGDTPVSVLSEAPIEELIDGHWRPVEPSRAVVR